jgi:membrane protease YdiL (CAAX protease family)
LRWMAAALAGAVAGAAIAGFVIGLVAALMQVHLPPTWYRLNTGLFTLVSAFSLQGVFLLGALRQAKRIGNGNRRSGLGWARSHHRAAVIALAITLLCCDCALILMVDRSTFLHRLAVKVGSLLFSPVHLTSGWLLTVLALRLILVIVIAPVCEELFFRGWLWTGLQRVWSIGPVMVVTATLWLAMHLADGIYRPLFLVPAAIFLTSIRAIAGSVRASIAAHMLNNGFAVALVTSLALFR